MTFKRIRLKRGTWTEWVGANPVLRDGEPGYITGGLNAGRMKVGNGTTAFLELPFVLADQTLDVEAVQDAAAQLLLNGTHTNVEVFYDDAAQAINLTTEFGITVEQAQDAAADLFETGDHVGIEFVYDDTTGKINATVTALGGGGGGGGVMIGDPQFIQASAPTVGELAGAGRYTWWDTSGGNLTLWIEDGA